MLAIGIMSGTSGDGIDLALVSFENETGALVKSYFKAFDKDAKSLINSALDVEKSNVQLISKLNFLLPYLYKEAIDELLESLNLCYKDITFIAMHGQTIWHEIGSFSHTFQIGDGSVMSALTKTTVIYNFRTSDVALGGNGAPLVPGAEMFLYKKHIPIAFQNIGGISNISFLKGENELLAYDQGVGNAGLDYFMKKLFQKEYDFNGETARKGKVIDKFFTALIKNRYYDKPYPKSTGRELFSRTYYENLFSRFHLENEKKEDILRTLLEEVVYILTKSYRDLKVKKVCVTGGGAQNKFLLERLKVENPKVIFIAPSELGIDGDSKEAFCFAVLGYLTLLGKHGNIKRVTGASDEISLGVVAKNY